MAQYPTVGFHFRVDFGLSDATSNDVRFQEVTGLTSALEHETLTEGGENRFTHRLPKPPTYDDLVLKRGVLTEQGESGVSLVNSALVKWFNDALINFKFEPVNVLVHLLDQSHNPLITWSFERAYPKSWAVSGLNAQSSELVIDEIELSYQYFRRLI